MAELVTEIVKTNLATQIFESLRRRILAGELEHGQPLTIKQISCEYGVSVTPAREALTLLANEGLVVIVPRTGTFVANLGLEELPQLFQFRLMMETFAVRHGLSSITDEEVARLARLVEEMQPLIEPHTMGIRTSYLDLDSEFHTMLVRLLRNPRIERAYTDLHVFTRVVRQQITLRPRVRVIENPAEHREIVAACAARDARRAVQALTTHLELVLVTLLEAAGMPPPPPLTCACGLVSLDDVGANVHVKS